MLALCKVAECIPPPIAEKTVPIISAIFLTFETFICVKGQEIAVSLGNYSIRRRRRRAMI